MSAAIRPVISFNLRKSSTSRSKYQKNIFDIYVEDVERWPGGLESERRCCRARFARRVEFPRQIALDLG